MKKIITLSCMVAVALCATYTDKYDNINVDEIFENERLFNGYRDCLLDKGPCTPEGKELKSHILDAAEDGCAKCTAKQDETVGRVIKRIIEEKPEVWKELTAKYDPDNKFWEKYKPEAIKRGVIKE